MNLSQNPQITTRQLRSLLFEVTNQEMTVRELRSLLTESHYQDVPITRSDVGNVTMLARLAEQDN